jgi:hypothetical protein
MAGKETHYVRRNSQTIAMEGEVLARNSGADHCPHLCRHDRTLPGFDDCLVHDGNGNEAGTGRTISGPTLAKEAQVLLEKWQNRGLRPDVLAAIRYEVFSVPAPKP